MEQYIPKSTVLTKIDSMLKFVEHTSHCDEASFNSGRWKALTSIKNFIDTIEVKDVDLENYNKVKKALSLSFMKFLDDNRQENKMCLSNGECFDIEKAFDEMDFAKLFRYMEKYLKTQKGEKI